MTEGTVTQIIDHGSIVQLWLTTADQKPLVVNFDRRQFAALYESLDGIALGDVLYHGFTADGIEVVSPEPLDVCYDCDCHDPTAMAGLKDECECDCHPREPEEEVDDRSDAEWREDRAIYRYERDRKGGW